MARDRHDEAFHRLNPYKPLTPEERARLIGEHVKAHEAMMDEVSGVSVIARGTPETDHQAHVEAHNEFYRGRGRLLNQWRDE